jgi:DNA mismatch repair ATPase MutL
MDQLRAQADAVVANLVTQFADPFDALRELCQNSIDAGTSRIEVWTSFEGAPGKPGVIEIHVDDFGEGMDEAIIDNQFTRLFASTKDKDFTKIG